MWTILSVNICYECICCHLTMVQDSESLEKIWRNKLLLLLFFNRLKNILLLLSKLFLWLEKIIQAGWSVSHGLSNKWSGSWVVSIFAWSLEQKTFRGWSLIGVNQRCGRADRWGAVKITQSIEEVEKLILCIDVFHFTWRTSPKGDYGVNGVTVFVCGKQKVSQLPRNCWRNVKMSIQYWCWIYKSGFINPLVILCICN